MFNFSLWDMTPYSKTIYFDLLGQFNQSIWPAQLVIAIVSVCLCYFLIKPQTYSYKIILSSLALLWALSGYFFLIKHYSVINWAGEYFAYLFFLQSFILLVMALFVEFTVSDFFIHHAGDYYLKTLLLCLFILPLTGFFDGRLLVELDLFSLTPAFCLQSTLIFLFFIQQKLKYIFLLIPVLWAIISLGFAVSLNMIEAYWIILLLLIWLIQLSVRIKHSLSVHKK